MRTLVVSSTLAETVGNKLAGLLRGSVDTQGPTRASYDTAENALFQGPHELIAVVLSQEAERGLEVLRRLRRNTSCKLLAVGQASDSRLILQALNCGADHYLADDELETGLNGVLSR